MSWTWIFAGFLALLVVVGGWLWRLSGDPEPGESERERALKRLGLAEFRDRLLEDIAGSRRPPHHEEIVDRMRWILEDIEGAEAEEDSLGVVEPKDELDRLACEELMALERLMRTPDGQFAALIRKKDGSPKP
ncbi:MAG TPA: hypothetical protein DCM05_10400 [Elusimicrobia bacterium]|nr:hypothetical protein [Elusimicrobiota bacterium]